ncbi:cysteine desulfurase family protein [Glacieibacterium sp.]|uniref:cysteine desulfurase family protein n=1 Tax=Glacieibacterium sp. TaxID=2860237 RepID=UPI003AFFB935
MSAAYLDYAATAPIDAAAVAAMAEAARLGGNPSSVHGRGRAANALLEYSRGVVARHAGVAAEAVVLTSGGTEALGLALGGGHWGSVIVSAVEHDAVLAQATSAAVLPVDGDGVVDLAALERRLAAAPPRTLVAVMQANNETGVLQPLAEVARLTLAAGGLLLVDAVQAFGKLPVPEADFVAVSAHKLGGPPGVGALIVRDPATLQAVQRGGGQERGLRGGTPNLPGIAGFAAALDARAADTGWLDRATALRDRLEARLDVRPYSAAAPRLGTIACLPMAGVPAMTQVMALDMAGFAVSAGAACSSGKVRASHVLSAMGAPAPGEAIRVSLGWGTTVAEIDAFTVAWLALRDRLHRRAA